MAKNLKYFIVYNLKHIHIVKITNVLKKEAISYHETKIRDYLSSNNLATKIQSCDYPMLLATTNLLVRESQKRELVNANLFDLVPVMGIVADDTKSMKFHVVKYDDDNAFHPKHNLSREYLKNLLTDKPYAPKTFRVYYSG
jgi:hypothetical protein